MVFPKHFNVVYSVFRVKKRHLKLFIAAISISIISVQTQAESLERRIASSALALRQSALDSDVSFGYLVNRMPGARIIDSDALPLLWNLSFSNMVVKLGRLRSSSPVSLYYDPLLDVALLAYWIREEDTYRVTAVRSLPGDWLGSSMQESSLLPSWMSDQNPLSALEKTTGERLSAFTELHPVDATEGGRNDITFAEAAAGLRTVLPRLLWNADHRAQWTDKDSPYLWLESTLMQIESVLAEADSQQLLSVAPETDPDTASALADLPSQYLDELVLDLVLGSSQERLLIASSIADGDIYVMALCQIESSACRLRRFLFLSLID